MQPEFVTPESLLLDTAERLGRVRAGRIALRIHLSRLSQTYRDPAYGRIAGRMFDGLIASYRCQVFALSNGDLVATGKDMPFGDVDAVVYKLRTLFDSDPLVHHDPYGPEDGFCSWYDLETDYDAFLSMCRTALQEVGASAGLPRARRDQTHAAAPEDVERITGALTEAAVRPFITAQAAVNITPIGESTLAFQEIFVSVGDLARRLAPGIDIAGDRWLFQYFCEMLDTRLLAGIRSLMLYGREMPANLNLNVSTVLGQAFADFARRFPQARFCIEVQAIDAFANLAAFTRACALLHESGHRVLIDALTPLSLWMLADAALPVDAYKLMWSPDIAAGHHGASDRDPSTTIRVIGPEKVILAHCDTYAAIEWGLRQGLRTFQGRFVDATLIGRIENKFAPPATGAAP
ncbi:hypothetical protein [Oleispirillum naphthae]|uniref:hypothetical protein n=1 Tax=Oleispirillum naphthae TaxID=2838853 RepID=UPI003082520E